MATCKEGGAGYVRSPKKGYMRNPKAARLETPKGGFAVVHAYPMACAVVCLTDDDDYALIATFADESDATAFVDSERRKFAILRERAREERAKGVNVMLCGPYPEDYRVFPLSNIGIVHHK